LALSAGVLVVVRHRQWWWLGWCVLASATIWPLVWIMGGFTAGEAHWVGIYLLAVTGLYVWMAWRNLAAPLPLLGFSEFLAQHAKGVMPLIWSAAAIMLALQAFLLVKTNHVPLHWALFVLSALSLFALARQAPTLQWLALLPIGFSLLLFVGWAQDFKWLRPADITAQGIAVTALIVAGVFSAAAYALLWNAKRPGFWAALSAGGAFVHFIAICAALYTFDVGLKWGYVSLLLAIPFLIAAQRVASWRERMAGGNEALGMLAVGITFFLSAAVPLELRREWVTMAYAIELPAVAWIAWRLNLPILRWLAWLLAGTVTIRLVFNPYVLDYDVSSNPLLNWVLYGYGVPIVAFWIARDFLRRVRNDELVMAVEGSILAFAFLLLSLQVRSIFNPDGLGQPRFDVAERAWMAVSWGALALGLIYGNWRREHAVLRWGWRIIGGLAIALVTFGAAIQWDGLFVNAALGKAPIFNGLIVCFLIPALFAALGAWMLERMGQRIGALVAGIAALAFGFAFLSYEVRHYFAFTGDSVSSQTSATELYAYSIVWLVYGACLLIAGIVTRLPVLRYASLAVLVLVVGKVFLVDMADLTGLLRVASFLGLGIALLALGFVYRRYVFREETSPADSAQPAG
ncbi:MAG: putative rane protein, partial [Alphaproteobacteria bacterium]|nr:putative rane protein [Alphaproteobacteria bacterium]